MPDVITTINNTRTAYEGSAVVLADKQGGQQRLPPVYNRPISVSGVQTKLENRFDDYTYYTA